MSEVSCRSSNQLLAVLPSFVYQRLLPNLEEVSLVKGQTLYQPGQPLTEVYFPSEAAVSLLMILGDKSTTEIGIVGNQGMVGLPAILGGEYTTSYAIVQVAGTAMKLDRKIVREEFNRGEEFQKLLLLYAQAQLTQSAQISACQSHHLIEQRLARWLLLVSHATGKKKLPVTQQLISMMLGVRRASVTEAAISLQQAGIIAYSRGQIEILNLELLESVACECYRKIREESDRLLSNKL